MAARASMTMRATIERDQGGTDDLGAPAAPDWQPSAWDVPCRVWHDPAQEVIDGNKTAVIEPRRAIFPLGTDLTEGDRLANVTDRRLAELFSGPIGVTSVGRRADHLAVVLEAVRR